MSRAATKRVSRVAMGVAAVGVATTVAGVAATQPASISAGPAGQSRRVPAVTCGTANTCGITDSGAVLECPDAQCGDIPAADGVAAYATQRGNTTYVTYTSDGLPLTNLIRDFVPFGDVIADLTEPRLTEIVNSAYPNGNPIPADRANTSRPHRSRL
jgi:hypothetical protein